MGGGWKCLKIAFSGLLATAVVDIRPLELQSAYSEVIDECIYLLCGGNKIYCHILSHTQLISQSLHQYGRDRVCGFSWEGSRETCKFALGNPFSL